MLHKNKNIKTKDIERNYAKSNRIMALDLQNHHKAMLYEMCCNIIENENTSARVQFLEDRIRIPKQGLRERGYHDIHWFEICTTHLCFHLCDDPLEFLKYTINYSMSLSKEGVLHPIEYLFEEYIKIKDLFKDVFKREAKPVKEEKPAPVKTVTKLKDYVLDTGDGFSIH